MGYYRFVTNGVGIYEAVERDCPRNDSRRLNKPDGSWLPKRGVDYPGAVSFWTDFGLKKYFDSGLLKWHRSVIKGNIEVVMINRPEEILYEDEYQIILDNKFVKVKSQISLDDFIKRFGLESYGV